MKCPKCGNNSIRYVEKRIRPKRPEDRIVSYTRTNHDAICGKCGFKGEIK